MKKVCFITLIFNNISRELTSLRLKDQQSNSEIKWAQKNYQTSQTPNKAIAKNHWVAVIRNHLNSFKDKINRILIKSHSTVHQTRKSDNSTVEITICWPSNIKSNRDTTDRCQETSISANNHWMLLWLIQESETNNKFLVRHLNKWINQRSLISQTKCLMIIIKTHTFLIQMLEVAPNKISIIKEMIILPNNKWGEDQMEWWLQYRAAQIKVNCNNRKTWVHNNNLFSNKTCFKINSSSLNYNQHSIKQWHKWRLSNNFQVWISTRSTSNKLNKDNWIRDRLLDLHQSIIRIIRDLKLIWINIDSNPHNSFNPIILEED